MKTITYLNLINVLALSAYVDYRRRKIPNTYIIFFIILGTISGQYRFLYFLLYYFMMVFILAPLFYHFRMGGADLKIIALLFPWLGFEKSIYILLIANLLVLIRYFILNKKDDIPYVVYIFLGSVPILLFY